MILPLLGQLELRGCEPDPAKVLQRRANAPMRPSKPQKPADHGLFSDAAAQSDLVEMADAILAKAVLTGADIDRALDLLEASIKPRSE